MLVLKRKIGQRIILPEQGVTIDVVAIGRSRVRLGIAAPSGVPIRRWKVPDVLQAAKQGPAADDSGQKVRDAAAETEDHPRGIGISPANLDLWLTQRIIERTGSRISHLSVKMLDGQIVVRGRARSHHARQLAQAVVQEVMDSCNPSGRSVEFDIDVGQDYWRSAGHLQRIEKFLRKPQ